MIFKILLCGDTGSGKTSWLKRFIDNNFNEAEMQTISIDFTAKIIGADKFQIWDSAGAERFRTITNSYYKGADCVIVMCDLTQPISGWHLETWFNDFNHYCVLGTPVYLVATKADLTDRLQDGPRILEEGFLSRYGNIPKENCFITSARTGEGVQECVQRIHANLTVRASAVAVTNVTATVPLFNAQFKILFIGEPNSGVSSSINRAVFNTFSSIKLFEDNLTFKVKYVDSNRLQLFDYGVHRDNTRFHRVTDSPFRRIHAVVIMLDLTLDESLLFSQAAKYKKQCELHAQPAVQIYFVGTKVDLLASEKEGLLKLKSVLSAENFLYDDYFITSAKTGFGVLSCIESMNIKMHNHLAAHYTVNNFKADYQKDLSMRRFPAWMYRPSAMQLMLEKETQRNSNKLNFNTIFAHPGARTRAVLKAASANITNIDHTGMTIFRKGYGSKVEFKIKWYYFLCCLMKANSSTAQQSISNNRNIAGTPPISSTTTSIASARRVYASDNLLKCIFQFAASDMLLLQTGFLPKPAKLR